MNKLISTLILFLFIETTSAQSIFAPSDDWKQLGSYSSEGTTITGLLSVSPDTIQAVGKTITFWTQKVYSEPQTNPAFPQKSWHQVFTGLSVLCKKGQLVVMTMGLVENGVLIQDVATGYNEKKPNWQPIPADGIYHDAATTICDGSFLSLK